MSYGQPPYGQPNPYPQEPYGQPQYGPQDGRPPAPYGGANPYPAQGQPQAYAQPSAPGPYQRPTAPRPSTPVPRPGERRVAMIEFDMPITTMDHLPQFEITDVCGVVFGTATHPVDAGADAVINARQDAVKALVRMAKEAGAEAVVGLRFDATPAGHQVVVCATGTAVCAATDADVRIPDSADAVGAEQPSRGIPAVSSASEAPADGSRTSPDADEPSAPGSEHTRQSADGAVEVGRGGRPQPPQGFGGWAAGSSGQ